MDNADEWQEFQHLCQESLRKEDLDENFFQHFQEVIAAGGAREPIKGHLNPILRSIRAEMRIIRDEAYRRAEMQLHEILGAVSEDNLVRADTATIFLNLENEVLRSVATANLNRSTLEIRWSDRGIVPRAARQKSDQLISNVEHEPDYFADMEETESEVALQVKGHDGGLLGIVNLEFQTQRDESKMRIIRNRVKREFGRVSTHLIVLKALIENGPDHLAWHPEVHGPDMQQILTRLCHSAAASVDRDQTQVTIWNGHPTKKQGFVYATSGGWHLFKSHRTLHLSTTKLGQHLLASRGQCVEYDPRHDKALPRIFRSGGSGEGWLICFNRKDKSTGSIRGLAGLLLTSRGSGCDLVAESRRINVKEAFPEVARIISDGLQEHASIRANVVETSLTYALCSGPSQFEALLEKGLTSIPAEAGSIFVVQPMSHFLECVATTGLLRCKSQDPTNTSNGKRPGVCYDLADDQDTFTVAVISRDGCPICINQSDSIMEWSLAGIHDRLRWEAREVLPSDDSRNAPRRILAVAMMDGDRAVGVVQFIRSRFQPPFSSCDEDVCVRLARIGARIVTANIKKIAGGDLPVQPVERSHCFASS